MKEILNEILIPVSIVGGIALFFGVILTIAGKFFEVKKNEKAEAIREILPGANCGACGYSVVIYMPKPLRREKPRVIYAYREPMPRQ